MEKAYLKGLGYGLTSGIITTIGLMVGLDAGTGSEAAVLGGILVIAVGDSMSDALGMHISEESTGDGSVNRHKDAWKSTLSTFVFKFLFACIFVIPVLIFPLHFAVWLSVGVGIIIIGIFSYDFAKKQGVKPFRVVFEHLLITVIVVVLTKMIGDSVAKLFS